VGGRPLDATVVLEERLPTVEIHDRLATEGVDVVVVGVRQFQLDTIIALNGRLPTIKAHLAAVVIVGVR
jgi:2-keto-3-deoxy-L-rhamnonate aldolase RhmA